MVNLHSCSHNSSTHCDSIMDTLVMEFFSNTPSNKDCHNKKWENLDLHQQQNLHTTCLWSWAEAKWASTWCCVLKYILGCMHALVTTSHAYPHSCYVCFVYSRPLVATLCKHLKVAYTYPIRGTFGDDFNLAVWRIWLRSPNSNTIYL